MKTLENALRMSIRGEIHFDPLTCHVYSVDASIFELAPLGVVIAKSKEDLIQTIKIANEYKVPVTVRGAATGITGGCLGRGIIIDVSKYLNRIISIDTQKKETICEPGVVQDNLNWALKPHGLRLGPDTSTGNRATLGGMLANNSAGSRSLHFGRMVDDVISTEIVLASGEVIVFHATSDAEWEQKRQLATTEGHIYQTVWEIKQHYREEIEKHFPKIPRRVSGYNLDELLKDQPLNIAKLIAGSEGTLGIATEIKMRIVPVIKHSGLALLFFHDKLEAFHHVPELLNYQPVALEMLDDQIIELGRASPSMRHRLAWLKDYHPQSLFIVELAGTSPEDVKRKIDTLLQETEKRNCGFARESVLTEPEISRVWALRKAGLGILLSKRTYSRAIAFLEDLSVSPSQLAPFMKEFCSYLHSKGKSAGIYGHVGSGCMHIRPYINLHDPGELKLMQQMMIDVSSMILDFDGALSGEHGDGLIRSWLNPKMFGTKLMEAFAMLKTAFDPDNLMNPGKIVPQNQHFEELRSYPGEKLRSPKTFLDFQHEGGFELAVDLCNGNGLCRKKEKIMCPSFQATNDEFHSTRARAQALRSVIHGRLPMEDFTSRAMHDVMDLCLSCKGCKTECPSQVDMAKMKAEFLYHYQEKHGYTWRSRFFAHIGAIQHFSSKFANMVNYFNQLGWFKRILSKFGIAYERPLPTLANQRFSEWFSTHQQPENLGEKVVLFNDTFNEFNHPEVGQAAVKLLNALGYFVIVPSWKCCGRPAISKGFLKEARQQATELVQMLNTYAQLEIPIIGLEPSCLLTLKDDYLDLVGDSEIKLMAADLRSYCLTFDEFLARKEPLNLEWNLEPVEVRVHGHCHQKALVGMESTMKVLRSIPGFNVKEIDSGCCGMAGSFGYEKEHYDLSMRIGELCLFPAVKGLDDQTVILASGTSCRQQILDGTGKRAVHLAEALWNRVKKN